jgi:hypothetical protein
MITKTQSREMMEAAERVAAWMRDTGAFSAHDVMAADDIAESIRRERDEMGF